MPVMLRNKKMQKILEALIGKPSNMASPKLSRRASKINAKLLIQESSRLR